MNLYEYISAYRMNPNPAVAKSLGADERLVEYLKETPWNTSVNVVRGMCGSNRPSAPYTFHFTQQEVDIQGQSNTLLACDKVNEWFSYFNSLESGTIVKATITNIIKNGEPVTDTIDHVYKVVKYKKNETIYSEVMMWSWTVIEQNGSYGIPVVYYPSLLKNYIAIEYNFDQIDITLEIQPGYKIMVDVSTDPNQEEVIDYAYYAAEFGNSFKIPYGVFTDGTNVYTEGDIITPTSDITLWLYTLTITFYDENHNLMQNLSQLRTQESYYSCPNPIQAHPGDNIQLPNGLEAQPLDGTWYDDNNNSYQPGDYISISSDMNFTFVATTTQQEI